MALIEIVDENDNIIGKKEFEEVYVSFKTDKPFLHRGVHVFVLNSNGELLLQKRSNKVFVNPNQWDSSASGHVDIGDSYEEAAVKELNEELGISIPIHGLIFISKLTPDKDGPWSFNSLYLCKHNGPFSPNDEVDEIEFLSIIKIKKELKENQRLYTNIFKKMFSAYLRWLDEKSNDQEN